MRNEAKTDASRRLAASLLLAAACTAAFDDAAACPADVDADGMGCSPLTRQSSEVVAGGRVFNLSALPAAAKAFVCYDGRVAAAAEEPRSVFQRPAFADSTVLLVDGFVSAAEAAQLRSFIAGDRGAPGRTGKRTRHILGSQYDEDLRRQLTEASDEMFAEGDVVVDEVEERIAALIGVPFSSHEPPMRLAIEQVSASTGGGSAHFHHDKNRDLPRYVSVIIYLNTIAEGGETLFPALPFEASCGRVVHQRTAEMRKLATDFLEIVQPLSGSATDGGRTRVEVTPGSDLESRLTSLCALGGAGALAVRPVAGRALIFWHDTVDGEEVTSDLREGDLNRIFFTKDAL
eukprot:gnl/TRDRNA2_/TRDRNA2_156120_c0_seq3.p1 gnl/TRDRNA2_/TRDRNA2_156120_c0~~gnl/TRDRNA2_/TRDRNA2_156120_c0_seq3.p1  ORF type:complete len:346 (-),score=61.62 gnl/TRDRNA2_/TRDRNA2_156120_c0_seq3:186-1223(-)